MIASGPCAIDVLNVDRLHAWYGESHILHGMSFSLRRGEVVALLGRNGSGRTTTLRAIVGLIDKRQGSIQIGGKDTIRLSPHVIARMGVGYCPEERGIFASLSCEENLLLPPQQSGGGMSVDEIYSLLPNLAERRSTPGTRLSGGEQQMLAIARILRTGARLLLLDEISEGLAPVIVDRLFDLITELKSRGYTILLVEQNKYFAAPLADRFLVVEHGDITMRLSAAELEAKADLVDRSLGV
ncbi:MAG TPA: ABC transporter ATP-binding protein [Afipia sp.]|nr:ABC transporter ATP-binding protein [Afipia sp.]OUX60501.1 MAG: ABC transporter ATP-binding protein [Afipia sp. TMED4]HAO42684.1 ABC transporter ATP-binding protein [Afipia sp.]HBF53512.1 ABC transporter ATP-binding protein [Afipia sp.]HBR45646.1 ABC transporter ATP-binding protein [Afipia sp.]